MRFTFSVLSGISRKLIAHLDKVGPELQECFVLPNSSVIIELHGMGLVHWVASSDIQT